MPANDNFAFLLPILMLMFSGAFWLVARSGSRPARLWSLGYLCIAAAFSVPLLSHHVAISVVAILADTLFLAGFVCFGQALLARFAASAHIGWHLAFCALTMGLTAYAVLVAQSLSAELFVNDLACSALLACPLARVWRQAHRLVDKALLAVTGLVILDTLVRNAVLVLFARPSDDLSSYAGSDYAFVMQTTATVGGLLMALTALAAVTLDVVAVYRDAAERDPLTGLLNRRGFDAAFAAFTPEMRAGSAVIAFDIDHFKLVNDVHGHAAGDRVIQGVAELVAQALPKGGQAARFGGEEFVAIVPGCSQAAAGILADRWRLAIQARDWQDIGMSRRITASFGVDAVARGDHTVHDALGRADIALYAAKNGGRNQVAMMPAPVPEGPLLRVISRQDR